ncbi:MAG: SurA N-terminal domain-containing protein [Pyrinomonadaceae bacterium]
MAVIFAVIFGACSGDIGSNAGGGLANPNQVAASVNGTEIKMEELEKAIKAQGQGEEARMSPLELASARLSVLQQLIQTEVMFQKAQKEQTVPSEEEITVEVNKRKTSSGLSAEEFSRQMNLAGETEQSWRENVKKELALQKLQEKIAGKVVAPKDSEIDAFYNGKKDQFKNKRGAELAAIVIDPANSGQGDTTTNQDQANAKAKEIGQRALTGADFATLAREASEDLQTRSKGGDWRYFTEDELKQTMPAGVAEYVMTKMQNGQIIPQAIPLEGKLLIIKLQRKQETDEDLTLESPGVRQRVTELLINGRKSLLWQSYAAMAINEAKVENFLAQKVVENPNELSGARPAGAAIPEAANTNVGSANTTSNNMAVINSNAAANTNSAAANRPPANAPGNRPANANGGR